MRKRTRFRLTVLGLIAGFVAMSFGPPVIAGPDSAAKATTARDILLAPTWLQTLLSWLDGMLMSQVQKPEIPRPTSSALLGSGSTSSPVQPEIDVTPQAGPNMDPDG